MLPRRTPLRTGAMGSHREAASPEKVGDLLQRQFWLIRANSDDL